MNSLRRLLVAIGATVTTVSLAVFIPAYAWAATTQPALLSVGEELARRRPTVRRRGGFGIFACGAVCCLLVVAIIVVAIVLIQRRRRGPGPR
jgi:hypothetical protein